MAPTLLNRLTNNRKGFIIWCCNVLRVEVVLSGTCTLAITSQNFQILGCLRTIRGLWAQQSVRWQHLHFFLGTWTYSMSQIDGMANNFFLGPWTFSIPWIDDMANNFFLLLGIAWSRKLSGSIQPLYAREDRDIIWTKLGSNSSPLTPIAAASLATCSQWTFYRSVFTSL